MNAENPEKYKYDWIYEKGDRYGSSYHGRGLIRRILNSDPSSLLDVGCGNNEFCHELRNKGVQECVGVDFASSKADRTMDALNLEYRDKTFDFTTAFDVLEHIREEDVRKVLCEMARVGRRFAFTIALVDSRIRGPHGETLHPTVKPVAWWRGTIEEVGGNTTWENVTARDFWCTGVWT